MAETETKERTESEQETNAGNGHETRKAAVRAAAIAAASGATALAAKKAFSGRGSDSDEEGGDRRPARKVDDSLITTMVSSGWDAARDTLVPMLENAATHAGEYVAKNAPDVVTDTLVPQFIHGFERANKKSSSSDDDEQE
jgi:hypothetical protein